MLGLGHADDLEVAVVQDGGEVEGADGGSAEEGDEDVPVTVANTLVGPHAMVVHYRHTPITDTAVMRSIWLWQITFLAEAYLLLLVCSLINVYVAWTQ